MMSAHPESRSGFAVILGVLWNWRRFIAAIVLSVTVVAVVVSLLLPSWYRATASVLPPKQSDLFGSLGGATGSMLRSLTGGARLGGLGQKPAGYNYFAILRSRTAMEEVIRRFDLLRVYDIDDSSMTKAVRELADNTAFEEQLDENITIEVLDRDPVRAAEMANYFVELLNTISIRLGTTEARSNREFIEHRLSAARIDLANAEVKLKEYQERSGIMLTPEQTSGVSALAALYALKEKKELEVAIAERVATEANPLLQQLRAELGAMRERLSALPQTGMESYRLYRDVVIQQKILEFLVPVHEQAKLDEKKDVPVLLVLDRAVPPDRKVRPQRTLIVGLSASLALLASAILALFMHAVSGWAQGLPPPAGILKRWVQRVAARSGVRLDQSPPWTP